MNGFVKSTFASSSVVYVCVHLKNQHIKS